MQIKNVDSRSMYWRFASAPNGSAFILYQNRFENENCSVSANLERGFLKSGQSEIVDFTCSAYGETWVSDSCGLSG